MQLCESAATAQLYESVEAAPNGGVCYTAHTACAIALAVLSRSALALRDNSALAVAHSLPTTLCEFDHTGVSATLCYVFSTSKLPEVDSVIAERLIASTRLSPMSQMTLHQILIQRVSHPPNFHLAVAITPPLQIDIPCLLSYRCTLGVALPG